MADRERPREWYQLWCVRCYSGDERTGCILETWKGSHSEWQCVHYRRKRSSSSRRSLSWQNDSSRGRRDIALNVRSDMGHFLCCSRSRGLGGHVGSVILVQRVPAENTCMRCRPCGQARYEFHVGSVLPCGIDSSNRGSVVNLGPSVECLLASSLLKITHT